MMFKYLVLFLIALLTTYLKDYSSLQIAKTQYDKYHNQSDLQNFLYTRYKWVNRIKRGDLKALKVISKDDFYTLANRLGDESLQDIPMISPAFKVFAEPELTAIIVGMLENKKENIRETCKGFLKRFLNRSDLSTATKRKIKKSFREARRRNEIGDTTLGIHGRHFELYIPDDSD